MKKTFEKEISEEDKILFAKQDEMEIAKIGLTRDIRTYKDGIEMVVKMMKTAKYWEKRNLLEEMKVLKRELLYKYAMLKAIVNYG